MIKNQLPYMDFRKSLMRLRSIEDRVHMTKTLNDLLLKRKGSTLHLKEIATGQKMYRIIRIPGAGEFTADFSYPPKPEFCSLGRCNQSNQQVFYAGTSMGSCISENKEINVGDHIRAAMWETTRPLHVFDVRGQNEKPPSRDAKVYMALRELFSYPENNFYSQTSLITRWLFEQQLPEISDITTNINAVVYPSVIESENSIISTNLAVQKSFVDYGGVKLIECSSSEVLEISEKRYSLKKLLTGRVGADGSRIEWSRVPETTRVLLPPQQTVTLTSNGTNWVPDNPNVTLVSPFYDVLK